MNRPYLTRRDVLRAAAAGAAACSPFAQAQTAWPTKPVTMIVPFPAGGGTDAFARPLGAQFTKQTGKQLIIDNRGGAGGTVGASLAARAAPDGYNLFMGAVHHTIAPSIYPKLDYDLQKDLIPITLVARVPQVVVVNPQRIPAKNIKELIALLRANPGKYNYASAGNGTSHHLAGELFKIQTKTFITHIPYRGAGPALQDLISGNAEIMFDGLGSSSNHIKSGRIRALMVAGDKRNPAFPDVPCAAEVGLPDYTVTTWYGIWVPKGTAADIQKHVADEVRKAIHTDELKAIWFQQGAEFPDLTQQQFATFIDGEVKRWAEVVKTANVKAD
ncbi:tripartite tricarboxylate transporter substrate binding protein [Ramlibacter sp. G-1-2-2]|uniref:Tripartite tricarboxylate transporter substrate binding protein n=1 Tax=Ramlibacter agri TaxID=2728837 RepID=A0A848H6R8_9BURK|nr:tripartite tricarboxylate transporter substrate binding protein [Ramlibacter agri]NML45201.1 tripartite tricarboxylate transporter substrate binding protein [Ramlibacter agri]